MPDITRRGFLAGLGAGLIAAPAIVSAANIMPVRKRLTTFDVTRVRQYEWDETRFIGEKLTIEDIKRAVAVMDRNNVEPNKDGFYHAIAGAPLPDGTMIYRRYCGPTAPFLVKHSC